MSASAISGINSNNETNTGLSRTMAISLFDSEKNQITISNSSKKLDIWIPRETLMMHTTFLYVNATSYSLKQNNNLLPNNFNISSENSSVHFQIKPENSSIGYFLVISFDSTPILNKTYKNFNYSMLFCPNGNKFLFLY